MEEAISLAISQNKTNNRFSSTHSMLHSSRNAWSLQSFQSLEQGWWQFYFQVYLMLYQTQYFHWLIYLGPSIRILSFCTYGCLFCVNTFYTHLPKGQPFLYTRIAISCVIGILVPGFISTARFLTRTILHGVLEPFLFLFQLQQGVQECWTWKGKRWNQTTS